MELYSGARPRLGGLVGLGVVADHGVVKDLGVVKSLGVVKGLGKGGQGSIQGDQDIAKSQARGSDVALQRGQ